MEAEARKPLLMTWAEPKYEGDTLNGFIASGTSDLR